MSGVADYQRNVLGMEFQATMSRPLVNAALKGRRRTQDKPSKKKMAITAAMLKKGQAVVAVESLPKRQATSLQQFAVCLQPFW